MTYNELKQLFPDKILPLAYPNAYPLAISDPLAIKGIVLGCDPSNFSKKDKSTKQLETVFGIEGKGKDKRYFNRILKNLNHINLSLENIYVQNLCRNYFTMETAKNTFWITAARLWATTLKKELQILQIQNSVPVFLTSKYLYHALLLDDIKKYSPNELYSKPELIPINSDDNYLERPLIPLYRGGVGKYDLEMWPDYLKRIISIISE